MTNTRMFLTNTPRRMGAGAALVAPAAGVSPAQARTPVTGRGTAGKIVKWTGMSKQGNSVVTESNGRIGMGTAMPSAQRIVDRAERMLGSL